jgi:hypothetical protein
MAVETLVKRAASETTLPAPGFHWKDFLTLLGVWFFGAVISIIPQVLLFFQLPVDNLTCRIFFSNIDILYICVTMTYVVFTSSVLLKSIMFISLNIIIVILGTAFFALLKSGVSFPLLEQENNLAKFIFFVFISSILLNISSFIYMCFESRRVK